MLETLVIFLLKLLHVFGNLEWMWYELKPSSRTNITRNTNVATEDVLLENLSIELLGLGVVTRESLLVVGNEETTVAGCNQKKSKL